MFPVTETAFDPTEKSPSDEGFTELELPMSGNAENPEIGSRPNSAATIQYQLGELPHSSYPKPEESQDETLFDSVCSSERKQEVDEGLVQNSSTEDATELLQVISETDKQGEVDDGIQEEKHASLATVEAKDVKSTGKEAMGNGDSDSNSNPTDSAVDQSRKLSLSDTAEALGKCSPQGCSPLGELQNGPMADEEMNEEERRKRTNKAEVKSWLQERMQAPIEGECSQKHVILFFRDRTTFFGQNICFWKALSLKTVTFVSYSITWLCVICYRENARPSISVRTTQV